MSVSLLFSIAVVIMALVCLVAFVLRRKGDWRVRSFSSVVAVLTFVCVMFSQDVNSTWLASIALAVFAVLSALSTFIAADSDSDVLAVLRSVVDVLRYVALGDLLVLVGLSLIERVIPFYVV